MNLTLTNHSRSRVLALILFGIGAVFVVRLFHLQVLEHAHYEELARSEHTSKFAIPARRGEIFAANRDGKLVPLVLNEPSYIVYADPRYVEDVDKVENVLRRVAGGDLEKDIDELLEDKKRLYVVLARQVTQEQMELIRKEKLKGIGFQTKDKRVYPEGMLASQLLGYVNHDGEGQYGVEGKLDDRLAGKPGLLKAVTDVNGIPLSISDKDIEKPAKHGENLVLNVDRNIQSYTEQALKAGLDRVGATKGSVVVMDPMTGGVLAMANYPTYDPAKYSEVSDYGLFQNRVVSEPYEAGSVIKILTMGVGLDKQVVRPETTFNNTGSTQVADRVIKNATRDSIGTTNMTQVLQYSLNTGVVHVLRLLSGGDGSEITKRGRDTFYDYLVNHYLFGKKTGVEQFGEAAGEIYSPDDEDGNMVRYSNMTFGQGMNVSMIQVAAAFAASINGGTYYKPQLVAGTMQDNGQVLLQQPEIVKQNVLSPSASRDLQEMIYQARHKGFVGKDDRPGYRIGGKTGTSQIIDPKTGAYTDDNSIGSYLGFGGDEAPRYVIMVRVIDSKAPGYAGTVAAAPIFADISNWLLDYMQVKPVQ